MTYGARKLPKIVLQALDGGESRIGRMLLWGTGAFFVVMALIFVFAPDPKNERWDVLPWMLGMFGVFFAGGAWIATKTWRVGRGFLANVLREAPERIKVVEEEVVQPRASGQGVERVGRPFNGESEFMPRPERGVRVLGVKVATRSWIMLKVEGKFMRQKLVVEYHRAPELLSYLFALLGERSKDTVWGEQPVSALIGSDEAAPVADVG